MEDEEDNFKLIESLNAQGLSDEQIAAELQRMYNSENRLIARPMLWWLRKIR